MSPHQNLAIRNAIIAATPTVKADITNAAAANPKYNTKSPHYFFSKTGGIIYHILMRT